MRCVALAPTEWANSLKAALNQAKSTLGRTNHSVRSVWGWTNCQGYIGFILYILTSLNEYYYSFRLNESQTVSTAIISRVLHLKKKAKFKDKSIIAS